MKKFFKILMVLALLSGAALSCTKDYSKEIADVQKQNQDLQALVASLQNALNSTNATVSQLSSTSDKQAADIAALASANAEAFATIVADHADDVAYLEGLITDLKAAGASELAAAVEGLKASIKAGDDKAAAATEKLESEIKACDEKAAKALADAVTTCKEDIAKLKEALEGKITDLETALTAALEAKAGALAEEIEKVDGKATANAAAIVEIDKTLEGIAATLEAYGKDIQKNADAIEANKTAIAAAQADLAKIKEQITSLSARLTNIVAAPAKGVELTQITLDTLKRSVIEMNFVVAPASAAEAIAAGNADVKLVLTNGKSRGTDCQNFTYVVTPDKVTAGENGSIYVYAVEDTTFAVAKGQKVFASLCVSGKDEAGEFERISDPVAVITGKTTEIKADDFQWFKDGKAVPTTEDVDVKNANHSKDSVVVVGKTLTIVAADADWTNAFPAYENVLEGYELKYAPESAHTLSIAEIEALFELKEGELAPHFTTVAATKAAVKTVYTTKISEPVEWADYISETGADDATKKLYTVKADTTSIKLGFKITKPADKVEEIVGTVAKVETKTIKFGKLLPTEATVVFYQRIGKHVEEEKAAEPLTLEFGVEEGDASLAYKYFESVKWLSNTQIAWGCQYWTRVNIYALKDGKIGEEIENSYGGVAPLPNKPKFVEMYVQLPYAKEEQHLRIVPQYDTQKNSYGIAVLEHGDYIDLTVEPYHPAVEKTAKAVKDLFVSRKTHTASFSTDLTVNGVLGDYKDWLVNDAKVDADDSAMVRTWYITKALNGQFITNANTVKAKQGNVEVGTAKLFLDENYTKNDTIYVEFKANEKFEEGKDVTVSVKDTIDGVIAFKYDFTFGTIKPEVKIATIPGFVKDDGKVEVAGKEANGKYTINDINLSQYFKFENVDKKHENDEISVKFSDDTTGLKYSGDSTYVIATGTKDAIQPDAKISWGTLKATEFNLTAQAQLEGEKVGEAVTVIVYTKDPIDKIADVKIEKVLKGKVAEIDLFKDLKIIGILDAKNSIYPSKLDVYDGVEPTIAEMKDWKCKVNDVDYPNDQMQQLFSGITGSVLSVKEHDALGTIVITIPCEFKYGFGKKEFNVILTIK